MSEEMTRFEELGKAVWVAMAQEANRKLKERIDTLEILLQESKLALHVTFSEHDCEWCKVWRMKFHAWKVRVDDVLGKEEVRG